MGIVEASKDVLATGDFGFEGAGVITEIGPNVEHLAIGDRVAFSSTGCFSTSQTMPEINCTKIPESLTFEEAATIPVVYGTALYGLLDLARLEKDQVSFSKRTCYYFKKGPNLFAVRFNPLSMWWSGTSCHSNSPDDRGRGLWPPS